MESVGSRLRQTRESRGYTIEQIARDTHIAKRFLEALEEENFDAFPGEPYLLGFLRKYSEHLGLSPEETVALYHNMQLQEQPPPIDELIAKKPSLPIGRVLIIAGAVLAVGVAAYFIFATRNLGDGAVADDPPAEDPAPVAAPDQQSSDAGTQIAGEIIEQRFVENETIEIQVQDNVYVIELDDISSEALTLSFEGQEVEIPIAEEFPLDLDGDEQNDVRVLVRQLNADSTPPTAVIRWDRGTGTMAEIPAIQPPERSADTPTVGSTIEETRQESARVLAEFTEREEVQVEVRFEGYALFRYEADNEPRVEQYFQAGETFATSVQDRFKLWTSNAASTRLRVAGRDIQLGDSGEVTAALVTWVPDEESGNELLELVPVY
jgi:cytoskeletal protein RodZ